MKNILAIVCAVFIVSTMAGQDGQRSDHYRRRVAQFAAEAPICSSDIVFLGNSLTEGGKWDEYYPEINRKLAKRNGAIRNRGIIGDTVDGIEERIDEILKGSPKKIFFLSGVNDISHDLSSDSIVNMIEKLMLRIQKESPKTKIYLESLLPFNESFRRYKKLDGKTYMVAEINAKLEKLAKRLHITFLNVYPLFLKEGTDVMDPEITSDGLHLNSRGYEIWSKAIEKYVK